MSVRKLQFWNNVLSANSLGAGSTLPMNQTPVVFDFLSASSAWVLTSESGVRAYAPGIAGLKNGGLTTESTLSDGKTWQATPFDTIQDTITLVPGGNSTPEGRADFMARLLLLQRQAQAYQIQSSEYRPVNICVNEVGDAGDRFSRIYDIQWAILGDMFALEYANLSLTLTIIRYPFWTPIPLGTNPKWYTFLSRGLDPSEFLVPPELARFPTDIGAYATTASGTAASFTVPQEGFTPDIGFGNAVIDWVSGTDNNGFIRIGTSGVPSSIAYVNESTDYLLSFWMRSESASYNAVPMRVEVYDQAANTLLTGANFTITAAANWVKVQVAFTTIVGSTGVWFAIRKNTSATNASYDIYGISVKAAANPMSLIDYGNANADLQNYVEADVRNIWTRANPADLRLNYVDIPAADVPGDAPALLMLVQDRDNVTNFTTNLYVARRSDVLDDEALYTMTFMAQGSVLSSPSGITSTYVVTTALGITSTPGGATSNRHALRFVTGAGAISSAAIATWDFNNVMNGGKLAVFVRGDRSSGVAADIPMFLRLRAGGSGVVKAFDVVTTSREMASNGSGNFPSLTYMGVLDTTIIKNAIKTVDGLSINQVGYQLQLMYGGRSAGAAAEYRVTDVLLVPYDELFTTLIGVQSYAFTGDDDHMYTIMDNTGYFNQSADGISLLYDDRTPPNEDTYQPIELQGQKITLEPNRNNRLYFILGSSTGSPTNDSTLSFVTLRTRLNIVPQWRRWRSV